MGVGGVFLLSLSLAYRFHFRRLVVVVCVLSSSLLRFCCQRCPFLWLLPSVSVPRRHCFRGRLVIVVVSLIVNGVLLLLPLPDYCCCRCQRRRRVVFGGGVPEFSEKLSLY